jgi:prolyl oligopeptidase
MSPYHQVDPACHYPPILLTTSARDDRVHPGHARREQPTTPISRSTRR